MDDGSLKEIHKATGGAWGGNEVDKSYLRMLEDLVKPEAMEEFKQTQMLDYFDLLRNFETKKMSFTRENEGKITFKIPLSLRELGESDGIKMEAKVARFRGKTQFSWIGDKLRIEKVDVKSLFTSTIKSIVDHIGKMFTEPEIQDVKVILLVGGFSECDLVKEAFEQHFPTKILLNPYQASLAVLKGAVRYGHFQDIIATRIARYTIGREIWPEFKGHHDPKKKVKYGGKEHCKEVFSKIIEIGEEIPMHKVHVESSTATYADQKAAETRIYSSTHQQVTYTTDAGCEKLGSITFDLPESNIISDKDVTSFYYFGDTEIHVRVKINKTNEEFEKWIDCFSGNVPRLLV